MKNIDDIRKLNESFLTNTNDPKYELIKEMLSDDNCFFKISMDIALDILESLGIENSLDVYKELISEGNYVETKIITF